MKKIIIMIMLLTGDVAFALTQVQQDKLNGAFSVLKQYGVNPTILLPTVETIQPFSGSGSVSFTTDGAWIPTVMDNITNSFVHNASSLTIKQTKVGSSHQLNILDNDVEFERFTVNNGSGMYATGLGSTAIGQNSQYLVGICTAASGTTNKNCIKNDIRTAYQKLFKRNDDWYRSTESVSSIGDSVGEAMSGKLVDIKNGVQSMAYITAASMLGQEATRDCTEGVPDAVCNALGNKFEKYSTKVQAIPITAEDYNLSLSGLFDLSDALGDIDSVRIEHEGDIFSPSVNGDLTFGHVQWDQI